MREITTSKGQFLFIEVPDESYDFEHVTDQSEIPYKPAVMYYTKCEKTCYPQGNMVAIGLNFEIISTTKDISEEQSKSVIERCFPFDNDMTMYFKDYVGYKFLKTAKESLISLIETNGLDINNNYLIIKVSKDVN